MSNDGGLRLGDDKRQERAKGLGTALTSRNENGDALGVPLKKAWSQAGRMAVW